MHRTTYSSPTFTDAPALVPYGWDDRVATLFASLERVVEDAAPARVVRVERGACAVQTEGGERVAATVRTMPAAVGDWVVVRPSDDRSRSMVVDAIVPRWSALTRQGSEHDHDEQVLAANVDVVVIMAPLDRLRIARLERELLVAWESGAVPLVVLTKADLDADASSSLEMVRARLVGTDVVLTSAVTGDGVADVGAQLQPNRTAVLFGPSGAGKSTLANALLGEEVLATGAVREDDRRGRHTTTSRHLLPLPGGGVLIDTPGLRAIGIWSGDDGLAAAFADIIELAESCRFRDCQHDREPSCAVLAAVEAGDLDAARFASYQKLHREVASRRPRR